MELFNVDKIFKVLESNKWNDLIQIEERYLYKKLSRIRIGEIDEFNFVKTAIQNDLSQIDTEYVVSDWISLLIYKPGDYFGKHKDGYSYSSNEYETILSGGYLLNKDYTGGKFTIEGREIDPNIGELFYFGRFVEHEITPVQEGVRYSLHFAINKLKSNLII